ncbi:MAG: PAS domain S-box protein [Methylobacter sp.]
MEGHIIAWNPDAVLIYGWSEEEALQMSIGDRIPETLLKGELTKVHNLSLAKILKPYRSQRIAKNGAVLEVWITATALLNETGQMYAIATTERVR